MTTAATPEQRCDIDDIYPHLLCFVPPGEDPYFVSHVGAIVGTIYAAQDS